MTTSARSECLRVLEQLRAPTEDLLERTATKIVGPDASVASDRAALVAAARASCRTLGGRLTNPDDDDAALARQGELVWLDAELLTFVEEHYGSQGRAAAAAKRPRWRRTTAPTVSDLLPWIDGKRVRFLAEVVWHGDVHPRAAAARESMVHVPRALPRSFAHATALGGERRGESIWVVPPAGVTLELFGSALLDRSTRRRRTPLVGLNRALAPSALRTWVVLLHLYQQAGLPVDGRFPVRDLLRTILGITGAPVIVERRGGRGYRRFGSHDVDSIKDDFITFFGTRVHAAGTRASLGGELLVDLHVDLSEEAASRDMALRTKLSLRNRGEVLVAHARLVADLMIKDYFRIPRAVCSLPADDLRYALAIADALRGSKAAIRDGTALRVPLEKIVRAAGVDLDGQLRKHGPALFWPRERDEVVRIAELGGLGSIVAVGLGKEIEIEVTCSPELRESYKPLVAAWNRHDTGRGR